MADVTFTYRALSDETLLHVRHGEGIASCVSLTVREMAGDQPLDGTGILLRLDDAEHMAETVLRLVAEARQGKTKEAADDQ